MAGHLVCTVGTSHSMNTAAVVTGGVSRVFLQIPTASRDTADECDVAQSAVDRSELQGDGEYWPLQLMLCLMCMRFL